MNQPLFMSTAAGVLPISVGDQSAGLDGYRARRCTRECQGSTDDKRGAIFPALLKLEQAFINVDGKDIKLAPGMNLTAEIKTGQRRVIEYLLSPIQKAGNESLRER